VAGHGVEVREVHAEHHEVALREVDHAHHAEDQREADGRQFFASASRIPSGLPTWPARSLP
jgi:hypothetical protein